jgi:NTP pyrophosphatase (non-canonical NTP hydrolase)
VTDFTRYQEDARRTAAYPDIGNNTYYPVLGLCGEAGEVAEKIKKVMRDDAGHFSETKRHEIAKELGDVLWYCAALASELDLDLGEIAQLNLDKLSSRHERGVISGSGDNR